VAAEDIGVRWEARDQVHVLQHLVLVAFEELPAATDEERVTREQCVLKAESLVLLVNHCPH